MVPGPVEAAAAPSDVGDPVARPSDDRALLLSVQPAGFEVAPDATAFAFLPPADLPPCPPELTSRLRALEHETAGLVELARTTLAELRPLSVPHAMRSLDQSASASTMDTRL